MQGGYGAGAGHGMPASTSVIHGAHDYATGGPYGYYDVTGAFVPVSAPAPAPAARCLDTRRASATAVPSIAHAHAQPPHGTATDTGTCMDGAGTGEQPLGSRGSAADPSGRSTQHSFASYLVRDGDELERGLGSRSSGGSGICGGGGGDDEEMDMREMQHSVQDFDLTPPVPAAPPPTPLTPPLTPMDEGPPTPSSKPADEVGEEAKH